MRNIILKKGNDVFEDFYGIAMIALAQALWVLMQYLNTIVK